ncbi:MAG: DUF4340 domain-containing protein [Thermodesulfobacteriota bacterium]
MRKKTFIALLALCAAAALITAAYLYLARPKKPEVAMGALLYPNLDVNRVADIKVSSSTGDFSVKKTEAGWLSGRDFYYPADFDKVVRFLKGLSELKVGRVFSADMETLARLALREPDDKNASAGEKAAQFVLRDKDGKTILAVLAGRQREGKESQQFAGNQFKMPAGQYIRKQGSDTVYVVDRFFEMEEQKPADWMDKFLTRVDAGDVMRISLTNVEGGREIPIYELVRPAKDKDFEAVGFPPDEKIAKADVNRMAQFLSALSFDDVQKADPNASKDGHVFRFTLQNGVVYSVRFAAPSTPLGCQVALSVSYAPETAVSDALNKTQEAGAEQTARAEGQAATPTVKSPAEKAAEIAASVEKSNQQLAPWVFTLGKWRCDSLVRAREDLVEKQ